MTMRTISSIILAAATLAPGLVSANTPEGLKAQRAALAAACEMAGKPLLASEALQRALELEATLQKGPLSERACLLAAELLWGQGRFSEAVARFETLRRSDDRAVALDAEVRRAECFAAIGRLEESRDGVRRLDDPANGGHFAPDAGLLRIALDLSQGRNAEANAGLDLFLRRYPAHRDLAEARRFRGLVAAASGKPAEALALLGDFEDPAARLFRALCLDEQGRALPSAGLYASVAYASGDLAAPALLLSSHALERSGDLAGAEAAIRRYLERFPQDPARDHAKIWLAATLARRAEYAAALAATGPLE